MKKLILFDIDGTLLLTGGAGKQSFDRVFQELYQIEEAWRDILPDGRTDHSLIAELFQKNFQRRPQRDEVALVVEKYHQAMGEALPVSPRFRLLPGVAPLLEALRERDLGMLGLATGNFEAIAYQKLRRAGLHDYFSFGGFGSDHEDRYELTRVARERGLKRLGRNVDPEDVILIGDTVHDIRCGQRLGMTTVAVATGSTPLARLEELRPDFALENLEAWEEVLPIFE